MSDDSRTPEQLRRHYEVERELAQRLLNSTRAERTALFRTLYDELFARVPDHPRKLRRDSPETIKKAVAARMALLQGKLEGVQTFIEFAPGDCTLAYEVCRHVNRVIGVDISDQTGASSKAPPNFELVVYDGYNLNLPNASADLVFSYQFLEHLHPDDIEEHFRLVHRLLRPGGAYIFSTPHRFSGPHDISRFFTDTPTGFHFKEWTYAEMTALLKRIGFRSSHTYRFGKPRPCVCWTAATLFLEFLFSLLPRKLQRRLSSRIFQAVTMAAIK